MPRKGYLVNTKRAQAITTLIVVVMASGAAASPASAEVRTEFGDRVADGGDSDSPSVPALRSLRVSHDTTGLARVTLRSEGPGGVASKTTRVRVRRR